MSPSFLLALAICKSYLLLYKYSNCFLLQSHFITLAYEDEGDRVYWNVGIYNSDASYYPEENTHYSEHGKSLKWNIQPLNENFISHENDTNFVKHFTKIFSFLHFDVITSNVSFLRGPTHSYVTSAQDGSPQDRYLTSHRYSARPTRLPSPTVEPVPEALLTRPEFPFTIRYVKGPTVVTSIHRYNRHVWS
jgi:hypothetical protein